MARYKTHSRVTLPIPRIDQCVEATKSLGLTASEAVTIMIAAGLATYRKNVQDHPQVDETWMPHENGVSYESK